MFDDVNEFWKGIDASHKKQRDEFHKLCCEPCLTEAKVGDRVLVSGGPIGFGFEWTRFEVIVLEVADTAYHLEFVTETHPITKEKKRKWVHRFAVTDVLGPQNAQV